MDVADDYSTDEFMQVLRRFISLRGSPTRICSDDGTQLVGASNELKRIINDIEWSKVEKESTELGSIEWMFSPAFFSMVQWGCGSFSKDYQESIEMCCWISYHDIQRTSDLHV